MKLNPALLTVLFCLQATALADVLVPQNASWKYTKGTAPIASQWKDAGFNDTAWPSAPAPFYYGEALTGGTVLPDMRNNYTTIYLRRSFNLPDASSIDRLALRAFIDDGYIVWINGVEVARFNVTAAEPAYNDLAQAGIEPTWVTNSLPTPSQYLVAGNNVIAVQALNSSRTSTDLVFDLQLESTSDRIPPTISSINPLPGPVSELTAITVTFSEPVQGVAAADFLINNQPATQVTGAGATYTFTFPQPAFGPVDITWEAGHQITDFADPPHRFEATNTFSYTLADSNAPYLAAVIPPPGSTVRQLSSIELQFSEPVLNVQAADLLLNGSPATNLITRPANTYIFEFPPQPAGPANLSWAAQHGITDLAGNPFPSESWVYTVDPNLPVSQVVISEFLASAENAAGLRDEDGELQDWIEIHNTGNIAVNLAGWSLTDDPEEPSLWTFPAISVPADGRIIVFASAKDRKPTAPGSRLHTNFKLNTGGEYLALFNADSPRAAVTEFRDDYPEQRNDYSYGLDPAGAWRYFQVPNPGQPNGASTISGVVPKPDVTPKRGWYDAPFELRLTNALAGVTIRYTTDATIPTETTGAIYTGPLTVSSNLVLRAIAFRPNNLPSEILTHTFLFADQVLRQPDNPAGFPATWGTHPTGFPNGIVPADYGMDPEIVNDPAYSPDMIAALKALPVISIAMKTTDLFDANTGIYANPLDRGPQWERPCSIEFIPLSGGDFQEDAGIQVQGNAAREPQKQPKHPLRVTFKGDYGSKKLDYKMFPDSPVSSFDTLILRADFNYSWLHWNPAQRQRGQRVRDAWMKDSMRAMGGLASHNRYVHLFINGLYWGIYDPSERPDGSFGEAYLGGEKEDYDVINEGAAVDGTMNAYNAMLGITDVSTPAQYEAMKQYLDMPQFIDYMLLHFYVAHEDWFRNKNWYAIRPRDGSRGFLYVPWDGEMILGGETLNRVTATDLPSDLHPRLLANPQYRLDFADRVHRHFFNDGALTPNRNISRWQQRIREIELPIIAESARWGDYRRDVHPYQSPPYELYTREVQWRAELNRLVGNYFPGRTATVLSQLRAAGLYPSVAAPVLSQHGGKIAPGSQLQMTGSGSIYYTTDGSDPRVYHSGNVSPQARTYTVPVTISSSVHIKARSFSGGIWSALTEATFSTGSPRIPFRITEIMYNPEPAGDAFEFIELQNFGSIPLDITGYFLEGVDYIFPPGSIVNPGQIIVLGSSENPVTFAQRYPGLTTFGQFGGQLLNRGERLALVAPNGRVVHSVDFDDDSGWPAAADGAGSSLEIIDPFGDPDDPRNWIPSTAQIGSPGATNSTRLPSPLRINEVLAQSTDADWIELFPSETINLGGWSLAEAGSTNVFVFPQTQLAGGSYYTVSMRGPSSSHDFQAAFALDSDRETLLLLDPQGNVRDIFTYGPQAAGYSAGLIADRIALTQPTPRARNEAVQLAAPNLRINELAANPIAGESDWIEIYNADSQLPASLQGLFITVSNQVFEITSPAFIAPGGFVRLFADEQPGANHADLKLAAAGGTVRLLDSSGEFLDELAYGAQQEGLSFGRFPDGAQNLLTFDFPTPERSNSLGFPVEIASAPAGEIHISWPARVGQRYRIEVSSALPAWTTLSEVAATATRCTITNSTANSPRFFRVVALP
jgi:hypothetical protein